MPGSLWVTRGAGETQLSAAVSNIGGMDAGPVTLEFRDNGRRVGRVRCDVVPAGDSRLTNRAVLSVAWRPKPGLHRLEARLSGVANGKVLDGQSTTDYFWQAAE
jgi:hypothetical protein